MYPLLRTRRNGKDKDSLFVFELSFCCLYTSFQRTNDILSYRMLLNTPHLPIHRKKCLYTSALSVPFSYTNTRAACTLQPSAYCLYTSGVYTPQKTFHLSPVCEPKRRKWGPPLPSWRRGPLRRLGAPLILFYIVYLLRRCPQGLP